MSARLGAIAEPHGRRSRPERRPGAALNAHRSRGRKGAVGAGGRAASWRVLGNLPKKTGLSPLFSLEFGQITQNRKAAPPIPRRGHGLP
jgi:hypothetical protein